MRSLPLLAVAFGLYVPQQVAWLTRQGCAKPVEGREVHAHHLPAKQAAGHGIGQPRRHGHLVRVPPARLPEGLFQGPLDHGLIVPLNTSIDKGYTLVYNTSVHQPEVSLVKVSAMIPTERPAYRAMHRGVQSLTNGELLVVALGLTDTTTAETMLAQVDGSFGRMTRNIDAMDAKGLTTTKRLMLAASFELSRRWASEHREPSAAVRSPRHVFDLMGPRMDALTVEEFHVLILDAQHCLERDVTVTRGILNSSLVHPREAFKLAIAHHAAAIILVHNHPSGDPRPSSDDRAITEQLVAAGRLLDIPVHDHIIVARGAYFSFAEAGLL